MQVLKIIIVILEVLLLFNLLIFVHELGHFLAAKWRGLKIDRFAIWFGKPLWKKQIRGVEYALGWIPAGGYVSLPQMAPMEAIEGKSETPAENLPPVSAVDKIIVAFAGPFFSFGLAVVFALMVFSVGRPMSETERTTTIGYVFKGSPAEKVGLKPGDTILDVDGRPVTKFSGMGPSVRWRIVRSEGATIPVKVQRGDQILQVNCVPFKEQTKPWERKPLREIGVEPAHTVIVSSVANPGPAWAAGLRAGDKIFELNGSPVYSVLPFSDYIEAHGLSPLTVTGEHTNGQAFRFSMAPAVPTNAVDGKPRLGIYWDPRGIVKLVRPGVVDQIRGSVDAMISTFGALFSPKSDIKPQHLSGPLKITNIYYQLFQDPHGWRMALWFSVILNVNLALLNLLPIPVLDGGHIVLALVEAVRRKPLSVRLLSFVQTGFAVLIIGFMLYILFYDAQDSPWRRSKPPEMKFAPTPAAPQPEAPQ